jgi:flavin-dependent dehydrogenase
VLRGHFRGAEAEYCGWLITVRGGSGIEELRSDFLVDATGRSATVARAIGARRQRLDRLCGVSAVIPSSVKSQILIVEATAYGWWYAIPMPDCGTFVCLISDVDIVRAYGAVCPSIWLGLLKGVKSISQDLRHFPSSVSLRVQPCETTSLDRMIGNGWLAVGDAATSFDPLSSMGIEQALREGREAASAISGYLGGSVAAVKLYAEKQVDIFQNYVTARRRHYREEMRWLSQAFWARRQEVKRGLPLGHGLESNKSSAVE